jgi:hypothetical protein
MEVPVTTVTKYGFQSDREISWQLSDYHFLKKTMVRGVEISSEKDLNLGLICFEAQEAWL